MSAATARLSVVDEARLIEAERLLDACENAADAEITYLRAPFDSALERQATAAMSSACHRIYKLRDALDSLRELIRARRSSS